MKGKLLQWWREWWKTVVMTLVFLAFGSLAFWIGTLTAGCGPSLQQCCLLQGEIDDCRAALAISESEKLALAGGLADCEGQLAGCESELAMAGITPPLVVGSISHQDMICLLREKFPEASWRGAESSSFDLTSLSEVQRFLNEDLTDEEGLADESDYIFRLMGSFNQPGWEQIPVGWAKVSDGDFYMIVVVEVVEGEKVYKLAPRTDQLTELVSDHDVMIVVVE